MREQSAKRLGARHFIHPTVRCKCIAILIKVKRNTKCSSSYKTSNVRVCFVVAPLEKRFLKVFSSCPPAAWNVSTWHVPNSCYSVTIIFQCFFHIRTEWSDTYNQDAAASAMWSSETRTNPLLSAAGGPTPGQTLQPNDLSSAMESSTNLVAFVRAQKKMPHINLALDIHLVLRLKTSSKLAKQHGAHGASCKNFGS